MCVEWAGALTPDGYPRRLYRGNANTRYHRVVYAESRGLDLDAIEGQVVRHTCDNPKCIDPAHLELGSEADNMRDRDVRERSGTAKLTPEQVLSIRRYAKSGMKKKDIADLFNVDARTVSSITLNQTWTWLHEED